MDRTKMCIDDQLDRLERMLRWIVLDRCNDTIKEHYRKAFMSEQDLDGALWKKPDISDIIKEKNGGVNK